MEFAPCVLCWYQRICLFPLVIILSTGLFPFDKRVVAYALPLAIAGWMTALYHNLLYSGIIPQDLQPCSKGVSCTEKYIELFGFITIPMLSLVGFTIIITLLILLKKGYPKMKYKIFAGTCLALIGLFVVTSLYYKKNKIECMTLWPKTMLPPLVRDYSQTLGNDDAKVFLVEFMDPACETCAAFSPLIKQIMAANPGKIKLVLRYAPFHDGADYFVKILEAAKKQGKYWETLDVMYKSQPYWASHSNPQPQRIWQFLPKAGLDLEQIKRDMNDPAIVKIIEQDLADVQTLNVRKTPGFFVNGRPLETFGLEQLYQLIQSEIDAKY